MKLLATLLLCLMAIACGCTRIVVTHKLGTPPSEKERTSDLFGRWLLDEKESVTVTAGDTPDQLQIEWHTAGKSETKRLTGSLTAFPSNDAPNAIPLLWIENDSPKGFLPVRVIGAGTNALALIFPSETHVAQLASTGTIKAEKVKIEDSDYWLIQSDGLEPHLTNNQFWDLSFAKVAIKQK
jgi:hypothetical protein